LTLRCGSISPAGEFFDRMLAKDIVAWISMIEGVWKPWAGC